MKPWGLRSTEFLIESLHLFEIDTLAAGLQAGIQTYYFGMNLGVEFILTSRSRVIGRTALNLIDDEDRDVDISVIEDRNASVFIPRLNIGLTLFIVEVLMSITSESFAVQTALRLDF